MYTTRNIFVLVGSLSDVRIALTALCFKGLTVLTTIEPNFSSENITRSLRNNKSIVCPQPASDKDAPKDAIFIHVTAGETVPETNLDSINISETNISKQFENIAQKHHCDIGDAKSNCSGAAGKPTVADCCYCNFLKNNGNFYNQRTVYASKHFFVMPTLGEFCSGYLLIIPYEHVMSSAEFNAEQLEDFLEVLEDVKFLLNLTYNTSDFLVWENGTGNDGKGKAKDSVVHSHIHIAPSKLTADSIRSASGFEFNKVNWSDIPKQYGKNSYLAVLDQNSNWIINDSNDLYIPRQYIRQLLAEEYDLSDFWNWRVFPFKERMYQTSTDILEAASKAWKYLPLRIKENISKCVC